MSNKARKKAEYTKVKKELYKMISEFCFSDESHLDDPVWQRAVEIGRSKHLPMMEAMKLAEQELNIK